MMTYDEYAQLITETEEASSISSDPRACINRPEYQKIVCEGIGVLRWVFADINSPRCYWLHFSLVRDICGESPKIPAHSLGVYEDLRTIYTAWGKKKGYL